MKKKKNNKKRSPTKVTELSCVYDIYGVIENIYDKTRSVMITLTPYERIFVDNDIKHVIYAFKSPIVSINDVSFNRITIEFLLNVDSLGYIVKPLMLKNATDMKITIFDNQDEAIEYYENNMRKEKKVWKM